MLLLGALVSLWVVKYHLLYINYPFENAYYSIQPVLPQKLPMLHLNSLEVKVFIGTNISYWS